MTERARALGRSLVSNTLHVASGRIAALLVWLVMIPPILRALGPQVFGIWALFFALTGHFAALDFGLVTSTLRHVAGARERGDHEEAGAFTTLAVLGYLVLGAVWLVLMLLFRDPLLAWLHVPPALAAEARFTMTASAGVFVCMGLANVAISVAQGYGRFDLGNTVTLALTAVQALGIPLVLHQRWGIRGLVVNVGLGWAFGALLGTLLIRRTIPKACLAAPGRALRELRRTFQFGAPLQVTSVLAVANQHLDKFLLARFVALAAITPYELGTRISMSAIALPQLLLLAAMPTAAVLHESADRERLLRLYERGGRYVLIATAATVAGMIGAGGRLLGTWIGPGQAEATLVLRGLAIGWALAMSAGMASSVARGIGRTDLEAWFNVASTAIHLGLALWLVPVLGVRGALIGFIAGNAVGAILFLSLLAAALGWSVTRVMIRPNLVPLLAGTAGALAGIGLDRLLPSTSHGWLGWGALGLVGGVCVLATLAVALATRYVQMRDLTGLMQSGRAGASVPGGSG